MGGGLSTLPEDILAKFNDLNEEEKKLVQGKYEDLIEGGTESEAAMTSLMAEYNKKETDVQEEKISLDINSKFDTTMMPLFGLGTWKSETGKVKEAVIKALESGYRHIDAAFVYQNQNEVGEGIDEFLKKTDGIKREDIWVTSKLWNYEHRIERVVPAIDNTLKELNLSYIDQWLIHWPTPFNKNENLDLFPKITIKVDEEGEEIEKKITDVDAEANSLEEIWLEMEKVVQEGKVRTIGVSNFNTDEIDRILKVCSIKPLVNQVECHPYYNQQDLKEYCKSNGIGIVAYCPLGNLNPNDPESISPMKDEVIVSLGTKYGKSPAQIILRWHLQVGNIVIPKSVTPSRVLENSLLYDFELTVEEIDTINLLGTTKKKRYLNPGFHANGRKVFPE